MTLHFYVRFSSHFGQTLYLSGNCNALGNDHFSSAVALNYLNEEFWQGTVHFSDPSDLVELQYRYLLKENEGIQISEGFDDRTIQMSEYTGDLVFIDTWNNTGDIGNAFFTQPFQQVIAQFKIPSYKTKLNKYFTHEFRIKAPFLKAGEVIFITGSGKALHNWDNEKPILLVKGSRWWSVRMNLSKEQFPVTYKYGIYNLKKGRFIQFESGNDRVLQVEEIKNKTVILHDGFANLHPAQWKGAGVAIPVFSLRSKTGFGTGEFMDIKLLVDWAREVKLKLIQLLPINDTTATNSFKDSYPYAAISAFALHPLYLNLEKVAGKEGAMFMKPLKKKQLQLNQLPYLEYEQVMKFKRLALKELYESQKEQFHNNAAYFDFFELNRHWLVPYAAFSFLRDKYKTSDFSKWKSNSIYDENAIQRLVSPSQKHYSEVAVHYFTQFHLHLQLKEVTEYAHSNGIIVKGDIPIGIYRNSVDAWMEPALFNMNEQAGAPPDDFAVKGQNWGFPTYNWKKMQEDNFSWWCRRFGQMSGYFDAFRIDHILGFFRIWSIPIHAVEGVMGRFVPAIPVHINEFFEKRISYDRQRYCKPFINDEILFELFGEELEAVKDSFLDGFELKPSFNTQKKIADYFSNIQDDTNKIKYKLFDLVSNVILFEDDNKDEQNFHFRIGMEKTSSFRYLDLHSQQQLKELYVNYYYRRQDDFWKKEALNKLPSLKYCTNMLICGEDLGMVPACVPDVMTQLGIMSLEIQRMPKKDGQEFFPPPGAPYMSVVTPSTHDMSTIREWWEENRDKTQRFYNNELGHYGQAPLICESWISKEIIMQHLYSPAMLSIFQLQDLLGIDEKLKRKDASQERINIPADPDHYWQFRMHMNLEELLKETSFNTELKLAVLAADR